MYYMNVVERDLPVEKATAAQIGTAQSRAGPRSVSARESVLGDTSHSERLNGSSSQLGNIPGHEDTRVGPRSVSTTESVLGDTSYSERENGSSSQLGNIPGHDYTGVQHHTWNAANAVVPAPVAGEGPEVMAWALVPVGKAALPLVVHCVLHRLLHLGPPSVRRLHACTLLYSSILAM